MLDDPKYITVFKKFTSLWLYNENILSLLNNQSIMIDSEVFIKDIYSKKDFFVDNKYVYECLSALKKNKNEMRYTISKYTKGLKQYFDPHKVVKAVYALHYILFYVKDKKDVFRKYYFYISSINIRDLIPAICKQTAQKNGLNSDLY